MSCGAGCPRRCRCTHACGGSCAHTGAGERGQVDRRGRVDTVAPTYDFRGEGKHVGLTGAVVIATPRPRLKKKKKKMFLDVDEAAGAGPHGWRRGLPPSDGRQREVRRPGSLHEFRAVPEQTHLWAPFKLWCAGPQTHANKWWRSRG